MSNRNDGTPPDTKTFMVEPRIFPGLMREILAMIQSRRSLARGLVEPLPLSERLDSVSRLLDTIDKSGLDYLSAYRHELQQDKNEMEEQHRGEEEKAVTKAEEDAKIKMDSEWERLFLLNYAEVTQAKGKLAL